MLTIAKNNLTSKNPQPFCYFFTWNITNGVYFKMNQNINNPYDLNYLGVFGETLKSYIDTIVDKKVNEVIEDYDKLKSYQNSTINSDKLCERWGRCKNSLRNLEKDGVISPLSIGGKTKIYSMNDVLMAEVNNPKLKRVS